MEKREKLPLCAQTGTRGLREGCQGAGGGEVLEWRVRYFVLHLTTDASSLLNLELQKLDLRFLPSKAEVLQKQFFSCECNHALTEEQVHCGFGLRNRLVFGSKGFTFQHQVPVSGYTQLGFYFIRINLNLNSIQAVTTTGAETCQSIFWITKIRPWRKDCAQTPWKEEQAISLLKLCAAFWGVSYAKCKIKSIFQKQVGKFRALVIELRKSQLFIPSLEVTSSKSACGTDCCSAGGLGQVAIGQKFVLQTHRSSWQPGWRFVYWYS